MIVASGLNRYTILSQKGLSSKNTLAYWTHFLVMNKIKCCKYDSRAIFTKNHFFTKGPNKLMFVPGKPVHQNVMQHSSLLRQFINYEENEAM